MIWSSIRGGGRYLHDLGECEVKHGMRIGVVNLYTDEVGNAQLPKKFQALKKRGTRVALDGDRGSVACARGNRWRHRNVFLLCGGRSTLGLAIVEKASRCFHLKTCSEDKANAYFADGIQDEILTR